MLSSSVLKASSPRFFSQRDADTRGNGCEVTRVIAVSPGRFTESASRRRDGNQSKSSSRFRYVPGFFPSTSTAVIRPNKSSPVNSVLTFLEGVWAETKRTLILPKSICFWMVYICSVLSIRWAPSLQLVTNCWIHIEDIMIMGNLNTHRLHCPLSRARWGRRDDALSELSTLLMACRAQTAAKYSAVLSGVFWQIVCEERTKCMRLS